MLRRVEARRPLVLALNALARSMGQADPYPFALPPPVLDKLVFVHDGLHGAQRQ